MVAAAAAAGVAGAKYAKDNPDQAKAGALILLVGGLILFNQISKTLDPFKNFGSGIKDAGEKTGDAVGNFFEGMFTGAETDYKIDSEITQPLGGATKEHLAQYEGLEYEDYLNLTASQPSRVPGRFKVPATPSHQTFLTEEDDYIYTYNYSTPRAIITTADEPGGGEAAGGGVYDALTGLYDEPLLEVPFTSRTLIPSVESIGSTITGWFR